MKLSPPGVALIGAAAMFGVSVAAAQTAAPFAQAPFAVPPYKNLKVLPAELSREQLLPIMKNFTQALGVRCSYCHVGEEGKPLATFDFASDAKPKKAIARKMLRMLTRINREDLGIQEVKDFKVRCYTCHRGAVKPLTAPPDATPATPAAAPKSERG